MDDGAWWEVTTREAPTSGGPIGEGGSPFGGAIVGRPSLIRRAMEVVAEPGGLFAVPISALARRRANPPPLIAEMDGPALLGRLDSPGALARVLDAAAHPSLRRPLEAVCAALDAEGAHASITTALAVAVVSADDAPALCLAVLLRLLQQLPLPAMPCELYPLVLDASAGALPALLRKRLPAAHAALIGALGATLGSLLLRCGVSHTATTPAAATEPEPERALRALVFALAPALMRAEKDAVGIPPADRAAADRATRHLLLYYLQREQYRALSLVSSESEAESGAAARSVRPPPIVPSPPPAAAAAATTERATTGRVASPTTRNAKSSASLGSTASSASSASSVRARSGALAMRSVATAITALFEREFATPKEQGSVPHVT